MYFSKGPPAKGEIESELAGVGKGERRANSVGAFQSDSLQRSGLGGRDHSSHAKSRRDGELGMNWNGEEEVGQHRDLIVVADQRSLLPFWDTVCDFRS